MDQQQQAPAAAASIAYVRFWLILTPIGILMRLERGLAQQQLQLLKHQQLQMHWLCWSLCVLCEGLTLASTQRYCNLGLLHDHNFKNYQTFPLKHPLLGSCSWLRTVAHLRTSAISKFAASGVDTMPTLTSKADSNLHTHAIILYRHTSA
jgi:hypothetical protein